MRNLEHELEVMRERLEEDYDAKQEIERQLSKALADANLWKARYVIANCSYSNAYGEYT